MGGREWGLNFPRLVGWVVGTGCVCFVVLSAAPSKAGGDLPVSTLFTMRTALLVNRGQDSTPRVPSGQCQHERDHPNPFEGFKAQKGP